MNIAQELSIVRDNIAEYGMTNITQLEYDAIYQQGKTDAIEEVMKMAKFNIRFENIAEEERFMQMCEQMQEGKSK